MANNANQVYDPAREELFYVSGDVPDPEGTGLRGTGHTHNLARNAIGHPLVRYKEHILEVDVHLDAEGELYAHLICPSCRNTLRIHARNKEMHYDPARRAEAGGELSIEPFACTWEVGAERQHFGVNLCRWSVGIEANIARDH